MKQRTSAPATAANRMLVDGRLSSHSQALICTYTIRIIRMLEEVMQIV